MSESEVALWSRLLQPESGTLSPEAARAILKLDFTIEDRARLHELATRGQSGSLSAGAFVATGECFTQPVPGQIGRAHV